MHDIYEIIMFRLPHSAQPAPAQTALRISE